MSNEAMATPGNEEDVLEDFFASLDIADDNLEEGEIVEQTSKVQTADAKVPVTQDVENEGYSGPPSAARIEKDKAKKPYQSQKQSLIGRAEETKSNWADFRNSQQESTRNESGASSLGAKPISFSLKQGKKTKKSKKAPKHGREQQTKTQPPAGFNITGEETTNDDTNRHQYQRPRWTAVVDTCCLLDDGGECIRQILRLAKSAQCLGDADPKCALTATSLDEICLVFPHVLWSELDGIVKRPQGRRFRSQHDDDELEKAEELSRKARGATRLLRDEMEIEAAALQSDHLLGVGYHQRVLLSQTMEEMKVASEKYLPPNSQNIVNDDHILACALAHAAQGVPEGSSPISVAVSHTAGGTVLLTNDRNLSCKALANNLRVFSPEEFCRHISLRFEVRKDLLTKQRLPNCVNSS